MPLVQMIGRSLVPLFPLLALASRASGAAPVEVDPDPADAAWVATENVASRRYLAQKPELRRAIVERAAELAPRNPALRTNLLGMTFFVSGGSLILADVGGGPDRKIVDAGALPPGSVVTEFRVSPDRTKLAYGFARYGTDWTTWRVLELSSGQELDGPFYVKSSGANEMNWDVDSSGLYYEGWGNASDDARGVRRPQIRYHRLGESVAADALVFEDDEDPHVSKYRARAIDGQTALVYRELGAAEIPFSAYVVRKEAGGGFGEPRALFPPNRFWGRFAGLDGPRALFRTSRLGDSYGIEGIDVVTGRRRTIVPARSDAVLIQAQQIGDALALQYLDSRLRGSIRVVDLRGRHRASWRPSDSGLTDLGSLSLLTGGAESQFGDFAHSAVAQSTETLRLDAKTGRIARLASPASAFDGSLVQAEQAEFPSADGERIPIQVYFRKDAPAPRFGYVYAYGSIGVPNLPSFNRKFQLALEMGGAVALPGARGGGEKGLSWQKAGVFNKWKTFEDIAWSSRWLKRRFPSIGDRVAMAGRSYGGLATMAQYAHFPGAFAAFVPVVGVSDPVSLLTKEMGWVYWDDLGFRRDGRGHLIYEREPAARISSYSPLNAVPFMRQAKPLMAFAAQYDSRVSSNQTIRFIQALRRKFGDQAPIRMIEHENVGHNGRAEAADEATFLALEFGVERLRPLVGGFKR